MAGHLNVSAFALATSVGVSAFGAFQDFTTNPVDWVYEVSDSTPNGAPSPGVQDFGWKPSNVTAANNNPGAAAGEAGGTFARTPLAYYHTTILGTQDPSTTPLTFSGLRSVNDGGTNEYIGFHNMLTGGTVNSANNYFDTSSPRDGNGSLIGFRLDDAILRVWASGANSNFLDIPVGPANPESFTFTFTPTESGATISGSVVKGGVSTPFSHNLTAAQRDDIADLTHFGLTTLGHDGTSSGIVFYDNLSFSVVPEPASLGLLGLGSLLALRRRGN